MNATILDCTLRDGSYAVDFGFTAADTKAISVTLDELGFRYIEVGHGIGLGASEKGYGVAACTDIEYMHWAHGNWGMFCIPGIAELKHLDLLAENGGSFVRVGCDVDKVETAKPFIERARDLGLYVFSNLMKSYAMEPEPFAMMARRCADYGAQCVYVVDSAGSMTPADIERYALHLNGQSRDFELGFHGHNNLGLAVANALKAMECGFSIIDTTLGGIGRGGGNVATEQFLGAGRLTGHHLLKVLDAVETHIRPIIGAECKRQLDVVSGVYGFHSSYMPRVLAYAKAQQVDPRRVIAALASMDRVNVTAELIEEATARVLKRWPRMDIGHYYGEEQGR